MCTIYTIFNLEVTVHCKSCSWKFGSAAHVSMSEQESLHAEQLEEIKVLLLGMHTCGPVQSVGVV